MKEESSSTSVANEISEANFFALLKDKIFVDYFNVFLTLPVFEQRVIYKCLTDEFEFDPPVKSAIPKVHVDKTRTLNWLYTVRLPLFLKTNLYLEYKLCRKLVASVSRKSANNDRQQLLLGCGNNADRFEDAIGHVTGMRQFRKYLDGGPGSRLLRLWLDVERFFGVSANDPLTRWMTFREIQVTFCDFDNRATDWRQMPAQAPCIFIDGRGFAEVESFQLVHNPTMSKKEVSEFISVTYSDHHQQQQQQQQQQLDFADSICLSGLKTLQGLLLSILRDYWLSKWLLHRQTVEWLHSFPKDKRKEEEENEEGEEKEEDDGGYEQIPIEQVKNEMDETVKAWPVKTRPGSEPAGGVVDETFLFSPKANEVITLHDDGTVTLTQIDPIISSKVIVTSAIKRAMETYLSGRAVGETGSPLSEFNSTISLVSNASNSSPSQTSLRSVSTVSSTGEPNVQLPPVSTAARKSMTLSGMKERQNDSTDADYQMRRNIVELQKLTSNCKELSEFNVRCRLPLVSSSSHSADGALCRRPSQPHLTTEPAASTTIGFRDDQQSFLRGIVGDRLAGGPFEAYLVAQGCDESRRILNFWRDAQVYLSCKSAGETSVQAYVRCRRAKVLIMRYLTGHSDKRLCVLPPALRYSLQRHLAIGKGDDLIRRAQDVAVEFLRPMWQSYLQNDTVTFQNAVVSIRRESFGFTLKPSSDRLASNYFQEQECHQEKLRKSGTEDPVMLERARSYEAARRTELALQYVIDMSEFCLDNLLVENYPESEIRIFPDPYYGSLAVKKFRIFHRPDILLELQRKRRLDELAWMRRQSMEEEEDEEDDLASIQSAIKPFMKGNKVIERPGKPESCDAIFEDSVQLEFFQRYLMGKKDGIAPLQFYLEVEKLKEMKNPVKQKEKIHEILNTYFKTIEDVKKLKCESRVLENIHYLQKQSSLQMMSIAQSAVRKCLISRWCEKYMQTFDMEEQAKAEAKKNTVYELWWKFLKGVNKLRHGLLDEETFQAFEIFVEKETAKDLTDGKTSEMTTFTTKEKRKVQLENVINDIRFMRDTEIYRMFYNQVKRRKRKNRATQEDEENVKAEAVRIYDTYFASDLTVNVSPEIAISMVQQFEADAIEQSLFHDAIIEIYPLVDRWWRRYMASKGRVENFWEKIEDIIKAKKRRKPRRKPSTDSIMSESDRGGLWGRRKGGKGGRQANAKQSDVFNIKQTLNFDDDRMHLVFSILNGLRLFLPRSLKSESKSTKQLIPGVYQIFYELPSIQSQGRATDGIYDEIQLKRMNTFLKSRDHKAFPVFVISGITYVMIQSGDSGNRHLHQTHGKMIHRT